ncbi:23S rRNA (uracil(1939)-C(5))-methyltransferase RlmD [Emticicia sp. 21SJ11W-3]|uniref:23S rRNA (uracil(1939)-C(5))-methyltransferase RlmD n=1 Tax=Emticicia sp. 21SJ11W-3 TaxID=2916755 RepID=UPI00209F6C6C|nr:23S rRNA (uracil(1939)-C(5))-methyltransferase RlmD [Emticicia sp. 21SJ11W-3]UTA66185.1 23S rRNA (uracil(1939)-C(5))-methyltransferase RlmD [Emticicia sp. 21SJ11W-3]
MARNKTFVIDSIEVENFAAEGKCFARHNGQVIFIEGSNVSPGDKVKLWVNNRKKNYAEANVLEILEASPLRIAPFCQHFGVCGGCKWQHVPYEKQLELKSQQVHDQLSRIGRLELPVINDILGSANTTFYRNKLEFTFSNSRWFTREEASLGEDTDKNALGFHVPKRFEKVLPIEKCYLQKDPSNQIRLALRDMANEQGYTYYDHIAHQGFLRNIMIRTTSIGHLMVMIQFAQNNESDIELVLGHLKEKFPEITSLNYVLNQKRNDTFHDLEVHTFAGKPYIEEKMEDLIFRIGAKSFYQTNSEQAYELYKLTREYAGLTGNELVYDLYTGTGTIANFVAKQARRVIGIEYVEAAVEDAKINSEVNNIHNTEFFAGDMRKFLTREFIELKGKPDVIITDPPRAGMDEPVTRTILDVAPQRIVYVSCNPATQARDLAILSEKYRILKVQPVDMFPHTHHVENIALLELKQ